MFVKFHERVKDSEKGFTLIELLVVILIIAILAAIAIPVFLNQRKKGWISQAESAVKNMATAEESFLTTGNVYTATLANLTSEGFRYSSADVTPTVHCINSGLRYVVKAVSIRDATIIRYYDSEVGRPEATTAQPATTCT